MTEERTAEGAKGAEDCSARDRDAAADGAATPHERPGGDNACSGEIVDAAMRVHSAIGPGALEQVYKVCLAYELRERGWPVEIEVPIEVVYRGMKMPVGYRADMIVDRRVIVEIKAATAITPRFEATMLSHLKLSKLRVGLIINFHEVHLRDGIKRMVNRL